MRGATSLTIVTARRIHRALVVLTALITITLGLFAAVRGAPVAQWQQRDTVSALQPQDQSAVLAPERRVRLSNSITPVDPPVTVLVELAGLVALLALAIGQLIPRVDRANAARCGLFVVAPRTAGARSRHPHPSRLTGGPRVVSGPARWVVRSPPHAEALVMGGPMSPSTVLRPRADETARWRAFLDHDAIVIVAAAIAAILLTQWLVEAPDRVPLSVVNDTDYELTIHATNAGDASWAPVVVIEPHQERNRFETIDQGDEWVFRFRGQGYSGGELAVSREALESSEWRLEVPPEVVATLEAAGATPPPRERLTLAGPRHDRVLMGSTARRCTHGRHERSSQRHQCPDRRSGSLARCRHARRLRRRVRLAVLRGQPRRR